MRVKNQIEEKKKEEEARGLENAIVTFLERLALAGKFCDDSLLDL